MNYCHLRFQKHLRNTIVLQKTFHIQGQKNIHNDSTLMDVIDNFQKFPLSSFLITILTTLKVDGNLFQVYFKSEGVR